jgi:hypothetical protein
LTNTKSVSRNINIFSYTLEQVLTQMFYVIEII